MNEWFLGQVLSVEGRITSADLAVLMMQFCGTRTSAVSHSPAVSGSKLTSKL